ncbi:2-dehydro-3-deoxyglucarate aldolase [Bifidobacterium sp. 82T24]|uniref:aldolase/citrate lyase family protein n=1 Tax=Bifidobacterium pluvialisilvae TaxID=2834436 RepID=UPI001C584481|nr:aldolase/citrate lyase family protein [Bifidobacterium pluvialisilvae]MBW3088851.1 2-dehydro-3-deoxyglucarate aldolase [Bifidobacterium pluvialisilvae]
MTSLPHNAFKQALKEGKEQYGLWMAMASPTAAEISADAGYDWLLVDGEHGPYDLTTILDVLRAVAPYDTTPVVRPAAADPVLIKQVLDLGAQTLLLPMVNSKEEAELMVKAVNYAPEGIRGVGSPIARSGRWGRIPNYMRDAKNEICLLLQCESQEALDHIDDIASVEGVDGIFIGPADLSASLGHPDDPAAIMDQVYHAFDVIKSHGKAVGFLAFDVPTAKEAFARGANFVAVAGDTDLYVRALAEGIKPFKNV